MRELTQFEVTNINGGLTNLETILSTTFAGGALGAAAGTFALMGTASGDYAFLVNIFGAAAGCMMGASAGLAIGFGVGAVIVGSSIAYAYYS